VSFYGQGVFGYDDADPPRYCAQNSQLSQVLCPVDAYMPYYRPNLPGSRKEFIRRWIDAQAPDSDPPNCIGVHHERDAIDDDEPA
jgi:hypothetical protein